MTKTVVVFFNARWNLPLRATNEAHLRCWGRYSRHQVIYVNVAFGVPWALLDRIRIDAVIFDTIFLSMHWSPEYFRAKSEPCLAVAKIACPKIALVQDEFYNIDQVVDFLRQIRVTHVFTCSAERDWRAFYSGLEGTGAVLETALTGYVDETRLANIRPVPPSKREIDIGYRAWENPYWLGEHGRQKVRIGQVVSEVACRRGLRVDINNPAALDFLIGENWFDFLSRCRAVIGVEGGASVSDHDGSLKRRVEAYLSEHPGATFEETRAACFADRDNEVALSALSPRHFEACMTRTCQILLEGHYNGVFEPWKHYIPIKKDYSNVEEALDALADDELVDRMVERAYEDIVASGRWSYRRFVADIEARIIDPAFRPATQARLLEPVLVKLLQLRAAFLWWLAHFQTTERHRKLSRLRNSFRSIASRVAHRVLPRAQ
jgi:hypothetical protein